MVCSANSDSARANSRWLRTISISCSASSAWERERVAWADGAATLAIGTVLALAAIFLAYETKGLLIGESANKDVRDSLAQIVAAHPVVDSVNEIRTMHFGPEDVLLVVSIDAKPSYDSTGVERSVTELETEIQAKHPEITRIFIETQSKRSGKPDDVTDAGEVLA